MTVQGDFIHSQMQTHHWEKASDYDVVVNKGFTALKPLAFTALDAEAIRDFRQRPAMLTKIAQLVFGGFSRCLYPVQKFQSDTERVMAIIADRESEKWFKPGRGQFHIFYKWGADQREYQPDFIAETTDAIYSLALTSGLVLNWRSSSCFFLGDAIAILIAMWRTAFRPIGPVAMLVERVSSFEEKIRFLRRGGGSRRNLRHLLVLVVEDGAGESSNLLQDAFQKSLRDSAGI